MGSKEAQSMTKTELDDLFVGAKEASDALGKHAEAQAERHGRMMQNSIGYFVDKLRKQGIKLPKSVRLDGIVDESFDFATAKIVRYEPGVNQLQLFSKPIGTWNSLSKKQQIETFISTLKGKHWLEYGPKVIEKLSQVAKIGKPLKNTTAI